MINPVSVCFIFPAQAIDLAFPRARLSDGISIADNVKIIERVIISSIRENFFTVIMEKYNYKIAVLSNGSLKYRQIPDW